MEKALQNMQKICHLKAIIYKCASLHWDQEIVLSLPPVVDLTDVQNVYI